jgi:signal transduction histidine kinase
MKEAATQILLQTQRIDRIVQSLVSFSHVGRPHPQDFVDIELSRSVNEAIHLLSLQKDKTPVRFLNQLPDSFRLKADAQRMIQVFVNLLSNARDASPAQGDIIVSGEQTERDIIVHVTDRGKGIDLELLDRVLEPFYTTKEPGQGTGLGLAMVYSIVSDHNGQVEVISPFNGAGVRVTLSFPSHFDLI